MKRLLKRVTALGGIGALVAALFVGLTALPASANNIDITCTTAYLEPHRALQNGDHINIDVVDGGEKFQVNAYVDRNIEGGWETYGLRLTTPSGQKLVPLTESEVKSGRLTFNFGQYLSGNHTVEWAQFNNTYYNQDRDPDKFFECGEPPVVPEQPADKTGVEPRTTDAVCVEPANGTATVEDQERTWVQKPVYDKDSNTWVFGKKEYTSDWTTVAVRTVDDAENCAPEEPPVVPAKPSADIVGTCGEATITLRNDAGESALTASFVVEVDGKFDGAYAVETGKEQVVTVAFPEDSGDHTVEVFQAGTSEYASLDKVTVESDCQLPPPVVPEDKVTETWEYAEYDCTNVPGDVLTDRQTIVTTTFALIDGQIVSEDSTEVFEFPYTLTEEDFAGLECDTPTEPPVTPEEPEQPTPPVTPEEPEEPVTPTPTPTTPPVTPEDDRECVDFDTQAEAQVAYFAGNKALDGDGDGQACESLIVKRTGAPTLPQTGSEFPWAALLLGVGLTGAGIYGATRRKAAA